jgi:hypothetical protein
MIMLSSLRTLRMPPFHTFSLVPPFSTTGLVMDDLSDTESAAICHFYGIKAWGKRLWLEGIKANPGR